MLHSPRLVRALVLHFADLAGWEGDRYLVTPSRRTFDRAARRSRLPSVSDDDNGATLVSVGPDPDPYPVTWISPEIRSMALLTRICAHEALHAARPAMPHGRAFERAVSKMLRGEEP